MIGLPDLACLVENCGQDELRARPRKQGWGGSECVYDALDRGEPPADVVSRQRTGEAFADCGVLVVLGDQPATVVL